MGSQRIWSAAFEDAVDDVREVIGDESMSGIPDHLVRDVVWDGNFDVQKSIEALFGTCLDVIKRCSG